jgi:hypothetical protein
MFRDHYNIPLVHVDASSCSSARSKASPTPRRSARPSAGCSSRCSRPRPRRSAARVPRPGHALSRRDRERLVHRRAVGHDQVAPQCRRPARAHEHEAGRAAARTVQGRGARARPRARPARRFVGRHPFPGPGLAIRSPARHAREARHPAQGRRDLSRRDPQGRALRRDLAGLRRAAAGADRRRDGRRPHLRFVCALRAVTSSTA